LSDKISEKDKKDWQKFISGKEKLSDKDLKKNINKSIKTKLIDLHGYSLESANQIIENFIIKSFEEGVTKLIVITGKGLHSNNQNNPYVSKDLSILKYSVPEYIQNNKNLARIVDLIQDARIEDGGSGAFYVYLKKKRK
jgi:DNA-nicking Smr family endonuclease